jgi:hypothetical protein
LRRLSRQSRGELSQLFGRARRDPLDCLSVLEEFGDELVASPPVSTAVSIKSGIARSAAHVRASSFSIATAAVAASAPISVSNFSRALRATIGPRRAA